MSVTIPQTKLQIKGAWIRPAAQGGNSALFFEVMNNSNQSDTLIAITFEHSEIVEIHETFKRSNDMMGMRSVEYVLVPSKSTVKFKPRGLHIMLIGLTKDIKIGEQYEVKLVFKKARDVRIKAVVSDMPKAN